MNYYTENGRVYNSNGEVAVRYYTTVPHNLKVNGKTYSFSVSRNICMAWISPEDVDAVLAVIKTCCNNIPRQVYRLEHEAHVRRWMGDAER